MGTARHLVLRRSWDRVGKDRGFIMMNDGIHLTETSGGLLLALLKPWMEKKLLQPQAEDGAASVPVAAGPEKVNEDS